MLHTIISWDCCFRNFHHLIDGLLCQEFPTDQFELIFVEQRSKEMSDNYNHQYGLPSLGDRWAQAREKINFSVLYLDDPLSKPYHLGKCNNAGLEHAQGDIVSIMDGDQLLPPDFLIKLTSAISKNPSAVLGIERKMAAFPVGVNSYGDWMHASNDFDKCLTACKGRYDPPPRKINNYGPMIAASKSLWSKIGGYDPSPVWATFLSTSGADVGARLTIAGGLPGEYLPACFAVHPWHPVAPDSLRFDPRGQKFFGLQRKLTEYSVQHSLSHHKDREELHRRIFTENEEFINSILGMREIDELQQEVDKSGLMMPKMICSFTQFSRRLASFLR